MTISFAELKRNRAAMTEKLAAELTKQNQTYSSKDERYWYPAVDKNGNGSAIIRFLPPMNGEDVPYVQSFSHSFKGKTGLWYIEKSLTTLKQDDPVGKLNSILWNQSTDDNSPGRKQARAQKRNLSFISNILVISDKANPENEGKNFLYGYGKKIFNKINDKMNPSFEDEVAMNPFDFWEGADFRIRIRQLDGYRNYDKSEFDAPSPLFGDDDDAKEALWNKLYSLSAEIAPDKFKTYEELERQLHKVLVMDGAEPTAPKTDTAEKLKEKKASKIKEKEAVKLPEMTLEDDDDSVDDILAELTKD
mgnify:CR=1 FL=1